MWAALRNMVIVSWGYILLRKIFIYWVGLCKIFKYEYRFSTSSFFRKYCLANRKFFITDIIYYSTLYYFKNPKYSDWYFYIYKGFKGYRKKSFYRKSDFFDGFSQFPKYYLSIIYCCILYLFNLSKCHHVYTFLS